jgi:hypothetical protein
MTEPEAMSREQLIDEVVKLRHLLDEQMKAGVGLGSSVEVEGLATYEGKPFVKVRSGEATWQWTPDEAREHALYTLNAAVEAERDAATVLFFREAGMEDEMAGAFLVGMREKRKDWKAEIG